MPQQPCESGGGIIPNRRCTLTVALLSLAALWLCAAGSPADILDFIPADSAHPRMLFSAADALALRANVHTGEVPGAAMEVLTRDATSFMQVSTDKYVFHAAVAGRAFTKQVLTLAMAGYITGEQSWIDKAVAVLCAVAEQSTPEDFAKLNGALAVGDVVHGFAIGYDWLEPWLNAAQRALVRDEIRAYGRWLYEHSQTDFWGADEERRMAHNWNGVTHGGLGLAALALGDEPRWLERAVERVRAYFKYSHDKTGAGYEGVTYLGYGLQNTVPFAAALLKQGGPDLIDEAPATQCIPDYILWQLLPWGGGIMPINQSGSMLQPAGGVFYLINRYQDRVGLWGWLRMFGAEGDGSYGASSWLGNGCTLPYVILWPDPELAPQHPDDAGLPLTRAFERGQVSARDGWGDLDTLVTFTSGRGIQGVWNHGDENSFSFCAKGEAFAVDPGSGWGKAGEHNGVLVDGIGQACDGGPAAVQGRIVKGEDRGGSVIIIGDATAAYTRSQPVRHALRRLLFVRGPQPYVLIADDIRKDDAEHEYSWLLHSGTGNEITLNPGANEATIVGSRRGATCRVLFLANEGTLSLETTVAEAKKREVPRLTAKATAVNPRFLVLLVACEAGQSPPEVSTSTGAEGTRVELRFEDGTRDIVTVTAEDIELQRAESGRAP